jgi:hypothetical protein
MTLPESQPWLSVLIPVFNVESYLEACVASVLSQVDEGVEVMLYDDASTDGSRALMQRLANRHPGRLTLLDGDRNRGLSAARNLLLAASHGRWIWFLDSDDFLLPGAIAGLRQWAAREDVDLVLCDFREHHDPQRPRHRITGERYQRTQDIPPRQPWRDAGALMTGAFALNQFHAWSKIGRRELYGDDLRFPEGRYFEDIATTPALLLRATTVVHVPEAWIAYRKRSGSILSTPNPAKWQHLLDAMDGLPALLHRHRDRLSETTHAAATYFIYRNWLGASGDARRAGEWGTAQRQLRQCQANAPRPPGTAFAFCLRRGWIWRGLRILAGVWRTTAARGQRATTI